MAKSLALVLDQSAEISCETDARSPGGEPHLSQVERLAANPPLPVAPTLTTRERQVLRWIAEGKSDWQIGQILQISPKTANYYAEKVKRKLGVATRVQAVYQASHNGLLPPPS